MMVVIAYSDKSRDYTVPDPSLLAAQPTSGHPAGPPVWQNPAMSAATSAQSPMPGGQVPSWDQTMNARPGFVSASGSFPGQNFAPSSYPQYSAAAMPVGSSPMPQTGQISPNAASMRMPLVNPGGASLPGQPPYYGH